MEQLQKPMKFSDAKTFDSVWDLGCLSRIPDPNFSIPDPASKRFRIRIRVKEFKYTVFNPKKCF
jgi:hypothetical protein